MGRFAQADSIIPLESQGVQAWDRYAGMNNNPVRCNDPSGHMQSCDEGPTLCGESVGMNQLDVIKKTFDKDHGQWGGLFQTYYAALYEAHWSYVKYRANPTDVTLKNYMEADISFAKQMKKWALGSVPQHALTDAMKQCPDFLGDCGSEAEASPDDEMGLPGIIDPDLSNFPKDKTPTPTSTRLPARTPTMTPLPPPTPSRNHKPVPIPRRYGSELIDF